MDMNTGKRIGLVLLAAVVMVCGLGCQRADEKSAAATAVPSAPAAVTEPAKQGEPTSAPAPVATAEPAGPDYADPASWAYFALGEDRGVDVFLICPLVDTRSERNAYDLNDKLKGRFVNALDMEKGIYEDAGRLYAPYYRQMSLGAIATEWYRSGTRLISTAPRRMHTFFSRQKCTSSARYAAQA